MTFYLSRDKIGSHYTTNSITRNVHPVENAAMIKSTKTLFSDRMIKSGIALFIDNFILHKHCVYVEK